MRYKLSLLNDVNYQTLNTIIPSDVPYRNLFAIPRGYLRDRNLNLYRHFGENRVPIPGIEVQLGTDASLISVPRHRGV